MNRYEFDGGLVVTSFETKTMADVERLISLGKPQAVIDRFLEMYLASLDPNQSLKDEWYESHKQIVDLEAIPVSITEERLDAEGVSYTHVIYEGRDLTEDEQATLDTHTAKRDKLENGFDHPAVVEVDENDIEVVISEAWHEEGTSWLAALRGVGVEAIPVFTPMDKAAHPINVKNAQKWVSEELAMSDIEIRKHEDSAPRVKGTNVQAWRTYRNDLRDYVQSGVVIGERPVKPS